MPLDPTIGAFSRGFLSRCTWCKGGWGKTGDPSLVTNAALTFFSKIVRCVVVAPWYSIPDEHLAPSRSALFMARWTKELTLTARGLPIDSWGSARDNIVLSARNNCFLHGTDEGERRDTW